MTAPLTVRQISARLRVVLADAGVDAHITVLHGRDGSTWSIRGDRPAALAAFTAAGLSPRVGEWILFVREDDARAVLEGKAAAR